MAEHELVVRGGSVVDGTGAPARTADVAVRGGVVTEVGRVGGRGTREIDADGLLYEGWQTGETCVCLWERVADRVEVLDDRGLIDDPVVALDLAVIADELLYDWPGMSGER